MKKETILIISSNVIFIFLGGKISFEIIIIK